MELLQQAPKNYHQLRSKKKLLAAVETYARHLKSRHDAWKTCLSQRKPDSDPSQVASEALEIALKEIDDFFGNAVISAGQRPAFHRGSNGVYRRPGVSKKGGKPTDTIRLSFQSAV
jgi:hypothetical protein